MCRNERDNVAQRLGIRLEYYTDTELKLTEIDLLHVEKSICIFENYI